MPVDGQSPNENSEDVDYERPHSLFYAERRLARVLQALFVTGLIGLLIADLFSWGESDEELAPVSAEIRLAETTDSAPSTTAAPPVSTRDIDEKVSIPTTTAPLRSFTLVATGDLISHGAVAERAATEDGSWDFGPLFSRVRPILAGADLALCHLESPLSMSDDDLSFRSTFRVPSSLADAIAGAGYDGCSLASNHSLDSGTSSVTSTLHHLHRVGLATTGMAETAETAGPALFTPGGIQVAHLSVTDLLNGRDLPVDPPWMVPHLNVDRVLEEATAARRSGAEFVVVSIHWGEEYRTDPTDRQQSVARRLLVSPEVDLVLGHHAHVIQGVERHGGDAVVYGLGNFLTNQPGDEVNPCRSCPPETQDGMIAWFMVQDVPGSGVEIVDAGYVPTWVDREVTHQIVPIGIDDPDHADADALSASAARTAAVVEPALRRLEFTVG